MGTMHVADEAAWLALREANIGGSEIAALFYRWLCPDGTEVIRHLYEEPPEGAIVIECLCSHTTGYRLWQQKAGRLQPAMLDGVERVDAGKFLEPALAEWAKSKWHGWPLRKVHRYIAHDQVDGWGASLDYEIHGDGMTGVPIEFKNVDYLIFRDQWLAEGDEILMPPIHINLQLQHQMGAIGKDHGWIVTCVGGNTLLRGKIMRHEPSQARIAQAVISFWNGVKAGIKPELVADYEAVADEFRYGETNKAVAALDLTADASMPALCRRYLRIKKHANRIETYLDNLKGRLALRLGNQARAKAQGFRLTWPVIERDEKEIPARIQKAMTYRGALTITGEKQ